MIAKYKASCLHQHSTSLAGCLHSTEVASPDGQQGEPHQSLVLEKKFSAGGAITSPIHLDKKQTYRAVAASSTEQTWRDHKNGPVYVTAYKSESILSPHKGLHAEHMHLHTWHGGYSPHGLGGRLLHFGITEMCIEHCRWL